MATIFLAGLASPGLPHGHDAPASGAVIGCSRLTDTAVMQPGAARCH